MASARPRTRWRLRIRTGSRLWTGHGTWLRPRAKHNNRAAELVKKPNICRLQLVRVWHRRWQDELLYTARVGVFWIDVDLRPATYLLSVPFSESPIEFRRLAWIWPARHRAPQFSTPL